MSTTPINSAHVCTAKSEPARMNLFLVASGSVDLFGLNKDRRFWIVDSNEIPPINWVGNIVPGTRCRDDIVDFRSTPELWNPADSDFHIYYDALDRTVACGDRHQHGTGRWHITLHHYANGREWDHLTWAVTDDFGWLVEVPA